MKNDKHVWIALKISYHKIAYGPHLSFTRIEHIVTQSIFIFDLRILKSFFSLISGPKENTTFFVSNILYV